MGISKPQALGPRSAGNHVGAAELYQECLAAEPNLTKEGMDTLKLMFTRDYYFSRPIFEPPPTVDKYSAISKETALKIRRQLSGKYRAILDMVRAQTKQEDRLFLLASWLKQEKVCEPEDIIGIKKLRRLAKKKFGFLSHSDFYHAERVRKCLRYFEKLLTDFGAHKGTVSELRKLGHNDVAIQAAQRKRSAIPAACEWLAGRHDSVSNVDAQTLQNAYSRIYGPKRRSVRKFHKAH
jgi:hypothetical protein